MGVYIDQHLNWKEHINNISSKIAKTVGVLFRSSKLIPVSIRSMLYYSLIYPYLTYCNLIWTSTYKSNFIRLVTLQKYAIRFIANIPRRAHTALYFKEFGLLKIDQIRHLQIGEFMYRYNHGLLPLVFNDFFNLTSDRHSYSTRKLTVYDLPYAHNNTRRFSIQYTGSQCWNSLPTHLHSLPNTRLFKHKLRLYLLKTLPDM